MYKVNTDIDRQLIILSVYILSASNTYIEEIDVKESSNVDWMSVRLKEKIKLIFMIKQMFI